MALRKLSCVLVDVVLAIALALAAMGFEVNVLFIQAVLLLGIFGCVVICGEAARRAQARDRRALTCVFFAAFFLLLVAGGILLFAFLMNLVTVLS